MESWSKDCDNYKKPLQSLKKYDMIQNDHLLSHKVFMFKMLYSLEKIFVIVSDGALSHTNTKKYKLSKLIE